MIRLFEEHQVRKTTELSSSLWDFSQVTDGKNTPVGKVTVPSCWESYPGFEAYRGQGLYERSFEAGKNMWMKMSCCVKATNIMPALWTTLGSRERFRIK